MNESADSIANLPFSDPSLGEGFKFKALPFGEAMAVVVERVRFLLVEEVKELARAFEDPADRSRFLREELAKIPRGNALNDRAMVWLVGDQEWRDSFKSLKKPDGEATEEIPKDFRMVGTAPELDLKTSAELIRRAKVEGDTAALNAALERMPAGDKTILVYRVLGLYNRDQAASLQAGGEPGKKGE